MAEATCQVCIVGGGPAGMMAGLLFARAGVHTVVLEKHRDFLRDFRGDTVHPSTLRIFSELGLLEKLLERPHNKVLNLEAYAMGRRMPIADFSGFDPRWAFIAMMPQWEFLDFVAEAASAYPHFTLIMEAEGRDLIREGHRVSGVAYSRRGEECTISADLVIAADGRRSVLRQASGLPLITFGAPMDVFWFRVSKTRHARNESTGIFTRGRIMALIDRGDYWQCAYVFPKGQAGTVQARGLEDFRADVAAVAPPLAGAVRTIESWEGVKLLTVGLDRLERWHTPGLLVIGDAAHTMSPIAGVGINVAIQDAVAAANILASPLAQGKNPDALLPKVQKRRMLAVRTIQAFQNAAQQRIILPLLQGQGPSRPPLALRLLARSRLLRRLPAAFLGFGVRPEHVRSPITRKPRSLQEANGALPSA